MNRAILLLILVVLAGCAPQGVQPAVADRTAGAEGTVTPVAAQTPLPPETTPPSHSDGGSLLPPPRSYRLPFNPEGHWAALTPIDSTAVLVALIPAKAPASDAERQGFVSELARVDVRTGSVKTLLRLPAGNNVYGAVIAGNTIAWVETSAVDLRAYGWKLHLTDAVTGEDRVVATDPGVRVAGVQSVIPSVAFDGTTLLFTALSDQGGDERWQLRRIEAGRQETIAELSEPTTRRFNWVMVDRGASAWIEVTHRPASQVLAIKPHSAAAISRRTVALDAIYQIALHGDRVFLATGRGVFETDRLGSQTPIRISPGDWTVSQMSVMADHLVYRAFDPAASVIATRIGSPDSVTLATGITAGPRAGNGALVFTKQATDPAATAEILVLGR